jgi:hypothetical protein
MTLAREQQCADSKHIRRKPVRSAVLANLAEQRQGPGGPGRDVRTNLASLQRLAGNQAVATLIAAAPTPVLHLALQDGPPLAPGNYRYGDESVHRGDDQAGHSGTGAKEYHELRQCSALSFRSWHPSSGATNASPNSPREPSSHSPDRRGSPRPPRC